eukprot:Gb_14693 [translate_table: standard]
MKAELSSRIEVKQKMHEADQDKQRDRVEHNLAEHVCEKEEQLQIVVAIEEGEQDTTSHTHGENKSSEDRFKSRLQGFGTMGDHVWIHISFLHGHGSHSNQSSTIYDLLAATYQVSSTTLLPMGTCSTASVVAGRGIFQFIQGQFLEVSHAPVYDEEWAFGYSEIGTGVFKCHPKENPMYTYRESIALGHTTLSPSKVNELLAELKTEWPGDSYDLLSKNCNHFCDAFCEKLGVQKLPAWVNRFANAGDAAMVVAESTALRTMIDMLVLALVPKTVLGLLYALIAIVEWCTSALLLKRNRQNPSLNSDSFPSLH